jgi:diguanylate cyclase (GGDEF)-like protein
MMRLAGLIDFGPFKGMGMGAVSLKEAPASHAADSVPADALGGIADAVLLADAQARVTYLNPAAERLLDLSTQKAYGHALDKVLALHDSESGRAVSVCESSSRGAPFDDTVHLLGRGGGERLPVQFSVARTRAGAGVTQGYFVKLHNVGGLQQHIGKRVAQTTDDEHTELPRRVELIKRMWQLLQQTEPGQPHAFLYLDLDNFKAVNDQVGAAAGDLAIRQIASRMKAVVREQDILARLGGNEFGLLLERCPLELARMCAEQLLRAVQSYVLHWNNEAYQVGVSIGLTYFKTHKHSLNTILSAADVACKQAKRIAGDGAHIREVALD